MRHLLIFCLLTLLIVSQLSAQAGASLAERLGYPAGSKLLIIHADDLAVAHAENQASFAALEKGLVSSASIMAPCPWLPEVAAFAQANPQYDLGMHLTMTSEWKHYKWGPAAAKGTVTSLVDKLGYLFDNCEEFAAQAKPEEVEREVRAQIERAKAMGINPTHLDSHMGCLFFTKPEFFEIYLKIGREYGIPTMLSRDFLSIAAPEMQRLVLPQDVVVDRVLMASPEDYKTGMAKFYEKALSNLQAGVSILLIHAAYENAEMHGVSIDHPDYGAAWRQSDFDFFTSEKCRQLLAAQNIHLITWKEIGKLIKK